MVRLAAVWFRILPPFRSRALTVSDRTKFRGSFRDTSRSNRNGSSAISCRSDAQTAGQRSFGGPQALVWTLLCVRERRLDPVLVEKAKEMNRQQNAIHSDFELRSRMKPLSFLSEVALRELARSLHYANFKRGEVIFPEEALAAGVHILLMGVAKITWVNQANRRVTVALLALGPVPEFVSPSVSQWYFRWEALSNCRVGSLSWDQFDTITRSASPSDLRAFHQNNLTQWYQWSLGFLGFDVRERLLFTLRHLCSTFGITESRGTFLPVFLSHKDLADLVGATRPRVTEHLAELEREHLLIRQGRQLIVCPREDREFNKRPKWFSRES